ncbi:hypothetical protein [Pseudonocardia endophytica]|uniref:Nudix hydrolase domain-containing protein n=1 Tax=Pseudonocardia endophytica TaxID=401976 RepID=A0A4R1HD88_PSEEN|nr:hypothetical protein [Pseudonocardia endophytica]TCK20017.1 hypothetical protein EV378_3964 [Pseudonocardia endophytica]
MDQRDDAWLRARRHLQANRYELGMAAHRELYPDTARVAGTPLLTAPQWMPVAPIPLDVVVLERADSPLHGTPPPRYSEIMARLARPAVFENRPTYRLLDAVLDGDRPHMRFGDGRYFDGVDTGEAVAHEFAEAHLTRTNGTFEQSHCSKVPFVGQGGGARSAIGDPVDPSRRPVNVAISAITIRRDDRSSFLVHHRDPARVAHAGGLLQVLPVGIFQPVSPDTAEHDFDLWRCLQREFVEELLGEPEATGRVEYERWEGMHPFVLGMGVDPLTLATDLLVAVVVDPSAYDRTFAARVAENDEGTVSEHPFTADVVDRLVHEERMQAAGAAVVALAWKYRDELLS